MTPDDPYIDAGVIMAEKDSRGFEIAVLGKDGISSAWASLLVASEFNGPHEHILADGTERGSTDLPPAFR